MLQASGRQWPCFVHIPHFDITCNYNPGNYSIGTWLVLNNWINEPKWPSQAAFSIERIFCPGVKSSLYIQNNICLQILRCSSVLASEKSKGLLPGTPTAPTLAKVRRMSWGYKRPLVWLVQSYWSAVVINSRGAPFSNAEPFLAHTVRETHGVVQDVPLEGFTCPNILAATPQH